MDQRITLLLHVLSVVVWVGGMFFAYVALRPAAVQTLEPPQRLTLWEAVFSRFFPWVWLTIVALLASGLYLIAAYGGFGVAGLHIHAMLALGSIMMLIFAFVYFVRYPRLRRGVAAQEWKAAASALAHIRVLIGVNLSIGIVVIFIAILGKLWV